MDAAKTTFLFGPVPRGADLDDPHERSRLLHLHHHPSGRTVQRAAREALANQVLDDEPPQVWHTVRRLLDQGLDGQDVMRQLVLTLTPYIIGALGGELAFDPERYAQALSRLPLPGAGAVRAALLVAARTRGRATMQELITDAAGALGAVADDSGVEALLERLLEDLLDEASDVQMLAGDVVVDVRGLLSEAVLTTVLDAATADLLLDAWVDLAAFDQLHPPAAPLAVGEPGAVAVRLVDGTPQFTALAAAPAVDPALVALLRRCYDRAVDEPWLPVAVSELVLAALAEEPRSFATAQARLTRLVAEAGLELRGGEVAHESSVWHTAEDVPVVARLRTQLDDDEFDAVLHVSGLVAEDLDRAAARGALDRLEDPIVLEAAVDLLLGRADDPERLEATAGFAARLASAASRPTQRAVAGWLLAVVAERQGRPHDAERLLRDAVHADPEWPPAVDRLAWYVADRGDAAAALALWEGLGVTAEDSDDVRELRALATAPAAALGRNERCWCGSGRKFKQCHLGRPEPLPLPERVGWLCRKATAYLGRRGGSCQDDVVDAVMARAVDDTDQDSVSAALQDPLVLDTVLHEGGWFDRFLAERGELLPPDEMLLAQAWTLVDRTVYEVEQTRAGEGVTVRDLASGERVEVRERTFSGTATVGDRFCGRAVPDGLTHQFIGGLFLVAPGREEQLLNLLETGDGQALLAYVAALHRPPVLIGPDGREIELGAAPTGPAPAPVVLDPEVARQVMEHLEQRWCTEPVPALAGLTPEQAVADPTRREDVRRLIDSFPEPDEARGVIALRPQSLKERLGLG